MSWKGQFGGKAEEPAAREARAGSGAQDAELEQALKDFRMSVHAWSEAEYSRARTAAPEVRRRSWRLAAGWALGCALAAGGVSGGVYEWNHQREVARIAAVRAAERQRQLAAQHEREEEALLVQVDSDISREVPSAMEPLAQLMAEHESR